MERQQSQVRRFGRGIRTEEQKREEEERKARIHREDELRGPADITNKYELEDLGGPELSENFHWSEEQAALDKEKGIIWFGFKGSAFISNEGIFEAASKFNGTLWSPVYIYEGRFNYVVQLGSELARKNGTRVPVPEFLDAMKEVGNWERMGCGWIATDSDQFRSKPMLFKRKNHIQIVYDHYA